MVRYVKNEGRPALGFAVESDESDESSDDEPLSDQPSLATLVSENPGSPPDSQAPFVPKSERRRSASRVSFKEDMAFVDRQGYTRDSENLEETVVRRVREALLLRRDLMIISGVEGALLGRRFFTGGRRRWLHVSVSWREDFWALNMRRARVFPGPRLRAV